MTRCTRTRTPSRWTWAATTTRPPTRTRSTSTRTAIAWTSGFGGMRGYYTNGMHTDAMTGEARMATATDPVPYAGGGVPSLERRGQRQHHADQYASASLEHNSYHRTQAASDKSSPTITTAAGRTLNKTDLQYVTQENTVSCTSTSGGGAGRFVIANLAGSYSGAAWDPACAQGVDRPPTAINRYFLEKLDDYTPKGNPGSTARARAARRTGSPSSATWSRSRSTARARASSTCPTRPTSSRPATSACPRSRLGQQPGPARQQRLGGVLAQRLHLRRRLHPRHRRPALQGPDQGRRAAEGLLELLR